LGNRRLIQSAVVENLPPAVQNRLKPFDASRSYRYNANLLQQVSPYQAPV